MKTNQIQQITRFLSAYPKDVVELGIEAWRTGEMPIVMEGRVTEVPLLKSIMSLRKKLMSYCECGMTEKRRGL